MASYHSEAPGGAFRVSVLLPAHNEAPTIRGIVQACAEHTPGLLEVLVIDDGSSDGTAEIAEAAGARVLRLQRNCGKGVALRRGFAQARGDVFVMMDADGQDDPREIPILLEALARGPDIVVGSRFLGRFGPGSITRVNWLGNAFLSLAASALFFTRITDAEAGFKAVRRDAVTRCRLRADRYDIEVDLLLGILRSGGRLVEVPVSRAARPHGRSGLSSIPDGTRVLLRILARRFTSKP